MLHYGTPCSTFCKLLHSDPKTAVRSHAFPMGLPNLVGKKLDKCETGNALAHTSAVLWKAQVAAGGHNQWELPATSLVTSHTTAGPILREAYDGTRPVCQDGAPWQKYTTVKATSPVIEAISARCYCKGRAIQLKGKAPDNRWWTAHASAY